MQDENKPQTASEPADPAVTAAPEAAAPATEAAPDAVPAADAAPAPADEIAGLRDALARAEQLAAEREEAWLRAKAETENVRRRSQDEVAKAGKFASEKFAQAMLPVKDSLEAALATDNATIESLRQGVELTLKQLVAAFSGANLAEVNPAGEKFDPNRHQAIGAVEADGEPNTVVNVLQKGYLLNERVIRPALVMVSKARSTPPAA